MNFYDILQWLIVIAIVMASALYMLGRIVPQWRLQLAQHLQQPRYALWVNQLGARLAGGSGGCGSCNTCGSCDAPKTAAKK
jgi:hypothetical protein